VGFLFFRDKKEMLNYLPAVRPDYKHKEHDPYPYLEQNELENIYHFAPGLIEQIKNTPGQEIGTHTFCHFYTLEKNITVAQFQNDLKAAMRIANEKGITINSIVFPRNQYSREYIDACSEAGIKVYRGNEPSWAYKPISREDESSFRRAVRFGDAYVNITGRHCHPIPAKDRIIDIPASRFLRPYNPKLKMFDSLKFARIKDGIKFAARQGLIYQLWWHPHNFGKHMDENFSFLERIFQVYRELEEKQKMESLNLSEIYQRIQNQ